MAHKRCGALKQSSKWKSQHLKAAERNSCCAYALLELNWEGGSSLADIWEYQYKELDLTALLFACCKNSHPFLWYIYVFVSLTGCLSLPKGVGVDLCPRGVEYRWNYYPNPNPATPLAHLLLQVCRLRESVLFLFSSPIILLLFQERYALHCQ